MEVYSYSYCILVNCLLFTSISCKSVSLNDIIAAEAQNKPLQTSQLTVSETETNKQLPKKYKVFTGTLTKRITGSIAQTNKKISPLQYKKTFQIRTPLRPKRFKHSYKPRSRHINTAKREIEYNEIFNKNYIPFLKSLSVLFNNVLRSDSRNDDDSDEYYIKPQSNSRSEECICAHKSERKTTYRKPIKKTTAVASSIALEIPTKIEINDLAEASSTAAHNTFNDNISTLRRNKNVPILPAGDSISSGRNNNGFSEGSVSTHNRNIEGHITRYNGSDENNNSRRKTTESYTENHKQHTDCSSGDNASCDGTNGAIGGTRYNTSKTTSEAPTFKTIVESNETLRYDRRNGNKSKGFDQFETGRNKTESRILLSESSSRLRRFESLEETTEISWQIENPKESVIDVTYNFTRNQRLSNRNSTVAQEDQEIRRADKKLTLDDLSTNLIHTTKSNLTQDNQKIVVIYDGYSIARDVNGENKLTEKAYRIHS